MAFGQAGAQLSFGWVTLKGETKVDSAGAGPGFINRAGPCLLLEGG